ncbi:hypothetical protein THRCLA_20465 [Thraustotheca clavata]|uniref:Transmembrane protein n=1 Tax=Thraustotheca clavata TaxID=74557 RepID=A0A1W0A725_9STRA|nr:hypothetical protein THRCLA_20465 [Thraustotheca clavata]
MAISINAVHQFLLGIAGVLSTVAAIYALADDTYLSQTRLDVANVFLRLYQLFFAFVLLSTAAFGWKLPLKWFSLLESFIGSGLYVIFLGFYSYRLLNDYGLYSSWYHFVIGIIFIIYGLFVKNDRSEYTPLLPQ